MSPLTKNIQKFLILFFTAVPVILVIIGVSRAKRSDTFSSITPTPSPRDTATNSVGSNTSSITVKGKMYQTPYGNVVASVTVTNGKVTGVAMPTVPNSPPSIYAEPYLVKQALIAGSANIQGVSGATYTSIAFKSSLESAIAQASSQQGQVITPNTTSIGVSATPTSKPVVPRRYRDDDDDEWDD